MTTGIDLKLKSLDIKILQRSGKEAYRRVRVKPRMYFFPKGESILEHLFQGRWTRPSREFKKQGLVAEALEKAGLPKDTKVRWSQHAGCRCPCSPGFIVEGGLDMAPFDIFVDYTNEEPTETERPA